MTDHTRQHGDEGYRGPAELISGERCIQVSVTLAGHFDPISGSYNWYGRIAADPKLGELIESGARSVVLRTPHGEVETALSDIDPWGRPRVEGFGAAPFPVMTTLPDEAS